MPLGEFELIGYFAQPRRADAQRRAHWHRRRWRAWSAASLARTGGCTDTLVEGLHFPVGSPAGSIGHRALAVNLSDLAAMGAEPAWCLLALTMPQPTKTCWRNSRARPADLCREHDVALVGGDTTRGPLADHGDADGIVPIGVALERKGAQARRRDFRQRFAGRRGGGSARSSRAGCTSPDPMSAQILRDRFLFPTPRCDIGVALRGLASACIDVSDGLGGDLEKLAPRAVAARSRCRGSCRCREALLRRGGPRAARANTR